MVGMKMGETTKWSNIAFGRIPLKLPTTSMPNVNLTTHSNNKNEQLLTSSLNNQRYRTELSLNVGNYSFSVKQADSDRLADKLHRLENERSSLNSQIQLLSEKLELQHDTIYEYEQLQRRTKTKYRNLTTNSSNFYHAHVHQQSPSFIHHDQLQPMIDPSQFLNEINHFKIRLDTLEKERYELEDKVRRLQEENEAYKSRLANGNNDWISSRSTSALNGRVTPLNRMSSYTTAEINVEPWVFVYPHVVTSALPPRYPLQHSIRRENDIERLKRRIESLVKSNDEKERKIEDLQSQITRYHSITLSSITPINEAELLISSSSNLKKVENSINNNNNNNTNQRPGYEADGDNSDSNSLPSDTSDKDSQPSQKPPSSSSCLLTRSSHNGHDSSINSYQNPLSKLKLDVLQRASSAEPMMTRELTSTPIRDKQPQQQYQQQHQQPAIIRTLTADERMNRPYDQSGYISDGPSQKYSIYKKATSTNLDKSKSSSAKGLKSIFGRIIRTNSGNFREDSEHHSHSPFQRGGLRATTSGGKTSLKPLSALETTFSRWQTEQVVNWLYGIGLGQYASECRKHFKNGLQLLHATPQELEKKIGMRNPLHRKKLQLCLNGLCTRQNEANILDTHWVQKWLDDIGLPQYKEYFVESKIDGRLLNNLTLEDIVYLNITNELHHLSIKRAIQVLRLNGFNPTCIKRRPSPDDKNDMTEIMHWSNHRVMEWLRSIDLSEYAPNLRGSGVCGALIILELRFNASTLAEILSIPMSKTLLRRHLTMRFQELIGNDLQNRKNQYEKSPNYQPLTAHTKIKFSRGLFAHRRTRSTEADDLVCPINENGIPNGISPSLKLVLAHDSPTTIV
ncbi:unnamed protein product [Adineta steineri]|uniref:SAM domain-containing protein n=1 Tax=Adineta steineri TaxID=433720 RepID=A0A819HRW1_9BILA|nr:unnamed protein product [Adineta steineri]